MNVQPFYSTSTASFETCVSTLQGSEISTPTTDFYSCNVPPSGSGDTLESSADDVDETITTIQRQGSPDMILEEEEEEEEGRILNDLITVHSDWTFAERHAARMAGWPKTYLLVSLFTMAVISGAGLWFGGFSMEADNTGWFSRGTLISDRQTQILLIVINQWYLLQRGEEAWQDLTTIVQPGWEGQQRGSTRQRRRNLVSSESLIGSTSQDATTSTPITTPWERLWELENTQNSPHKLGTHPLFNSDAQAAYNRWLHGHLRRQLQLQNDIFTNATEGGNNPTDITSPDTYNRLEGCDITWYTKQSTVFDTRLWPIWKVPNSDSSALDGQVLLDLCLAEERTQQVLVDYNLCKKCKDTNRCIPPLSVVFYARLSIPGGLYMDCNTLAEQWTSRSLPESTTDEWNACVTDLLDSFTIDTIPPSCPVYFSPTMTDQFFVSTGKVQYTSSLFANKKRTPQALYELVDEFDKGTSLIEGAYDTQYQHFANKYADEALQRDMYVATLSGLITAIAMLIHTKSPFLTMIGLIEIGLSFPLAFAIYTFVARLSFFPQLNFLGVFVAFALGADHVFVVVDKWKNARITSPPTATTQDIAIQALPDAAGAMLLTTSTTAVAFFGSIICPVAPVKLFGIFCGLLVSVDYIMDILLIFPSLCIYDAYRGKKNWFMHNTYVTPSQNTPADVDTAPETDSNANREIPHKDIHRSTHQGKADEASSESSFIRRILLSYFDVLHSFRYLLLILCMAAFAVCLYYATLLELPNTSEVRMLGGDVEYEKRFLWDADLLSTVMITRSGSSAYVIWGTTPADTGNHNDPTNWSTLKLDATFDPSTQAAQLYLRDFCPRFFSQDFANLPEENYECAINRFDDWLIRQSNSTSPDDIYLTSCANATGLPLRPDIFQSCLIDWTYQEDVSSILSRNGKVQIIFFPFSSRVRYNSPNSELGDEWNLIEDWMDNESENVAPYEVSRHFFSSTSFWWYDTNLSMFETAVGAAGIAIVAAAGIVLISSRSIVMTLFAAISVGYVLASVTSMLVAIGWTLGYLESICFAILIGISVDFVIHFVHAYVTPVGHVDRSFRTKFALLHMGPSILAAAFTTFAASVVMLFAIIIFFNKFALVLLFTILQATVASFVVLLTITDCFGPSNPTYIADMLCRRDEV